MSSSLRSFHLRYEFDPVPNADELGVVNLFQDSGLPYSTCTVSVLLHQHLQANECMHVMISQTNHIPASYNKDRDSYTKPDMDRIVETGELKHQYELHQIFRDW